MALSIPIREPGWIGEFKAFIARGSVIDLAVGIVIGAAFTGVVNSLVRDVINPIIGLAAGGIDFSNVFFALNGQHYNTLAAARRQVQPPSTLACSSTRSSTLLSSASLSSGSSRH